MMQAGIRKFTSHDLMAAIQHITPRKHIMNVTQLAGLMNFHRKRLGIEKVGDVTDAGMYYNHSKRELVLWRFSEGFLRTHRNTPSIHPEPRTPTPKPPKQSYCLCTTTKKDAKGNPKKYYSIRKSIRIKRKQQLEITQTIRKDGDLLPYRWNLK
jgi:hypothetical protein